MTKPQYRPSVDGVAVEAAKVSLEFLVARCGGAFAGVAEAADKLMSFLVETELHLAHWEWIRVVNKALLDAHERMVLETAQLRHDVSEWVCERCRQVYPGPPQEGLKCVLCPQCDGSTMPMPVHERNEARRELSALKEKYDKLLEYAHKLEEDGFPFDDAVASEGGIDLDKLKKP